MTVYELKLIREKLLELGLINKIADISSWLAHLNEEKIENLLSITSIDKIHESNKAALLDLDFLGSDNYKDIVEILKISTNKDVQKLLLETEGQVDVLSMTVCGIDSKKVLSTIALSKTGSRAKIVTEVALNENVYDKIPNNLYFSYLNHIINACSDEVAASIKKIILNTELEEYVKLQIIEKISATKDERLVKTICLLANATYPEGVESNKRVQDIEIISELEGLEKDYDFYILVENVALSEESLKSIFHCSDLRLIVKAIKEKEQPIVEALTSIAQYHQSLTSPYHNSDMELVFERGTSFNLEALTTLAQNETSIFSDCHALDMQTVAKVEEEEVYAEEKIKSLLTLAILPQSEGHLDEMKLMSITENTDNKISVLLSAILDEDLAESSQRTYYLFSIAEAKDYEDAYSIYERFLQAKEEEKQQNNIFCQNSTNEQIIDAIISAAAEFYNSDEIPNKVFKNYKRNN